MVRAEKHRSAASARAFGIVASAARVAVIFRRGPSKQVQLLRWDLERDVVQPGQWLSGRIYNERCGLSPNGRLLVYFAGKFKTEIATFTAVCRPPYFTALALWPDGTTWGGGGFFEGDRRLILHYGYVIPELHDHAGVPADFELDSITAYRQRHGPDATPEANQGWTLTVRGVDGVPDARMRVVFAEPWVHEKPHPLHPRWTLQRRWLGMFEVNGPSSVYSYRLIERGAAGKQLASEELGELDWADWDHDGSLLYSEHARLFRRSLVATRGVSPPAVLVADLRGNTFKNVIPPDNARVWP